MFRVDTIPVAMIAYKTMDSVVRVADGNEAIFSEPPAFEEVEES